MRRFFLLVCSLHSAWFSEHIHERSYWHMSTVIFETPSFTCSFLTFPLPPSTLSFSPRPPLHLISYGTSGRDTRRISGVRLRIWSFIRRPMTAFRCLNKHTLTWKKGPLIRTFIKTIPACNRYVRQQAKYRSLPLCPRGCAAKSETS